MPLLQGIHAIIIDDDILSIDVLASLLKQGGATYTAISYDILRHLEEAPAPDVVFIDLEIPEVSGYEILSTLQHSPAYANIPLVAYTTHLSHMNSAHEAGFNGFLAKPLNRNEFANQLLRILNGEEVWE
jgi:CheY-like chemotaxis protein